MSHGLACKNQSSNRPHVRPLKTRRGVSRGGPNERLGRNIKSKRVARAWKYSRRILAGLLLIMAAALAIIVRFVWTS